MKNKELVNKKLDKLRINIKNIDTVVIRNGSLEDLRTAIDLSLLTLDEAEGLISLESDLFQSNQILR